MKNSQNIETFKTDLELMERLTLELPRSSRVKRIGKTISVEYGHNMWRDQFSSVSQIIQALQKAHMES